MLKIILLAYFIVSVIAGFSACSSSGADTWVSRHSRDYQVSVKAGGREVKNFDKKLVHRVSITRRQLESLFHGRRRSPILARKAYDSTGGLSGLRVYRTPNSPGLPMLGLRDKDLVTAIGLIRPESSRDVLEIYDQLISQGRATLTLERKGKPHKILYYLSKPRKVS